MKEKYHYYFAYGMNTNKREMDWRCPTARAVGVAVLPKHRLDFDRHATVGVDNVESVKGVLWLLTDKDETILDLLEGFPRLYLKKVVKVYCRGQEFDAMTYYLPNSLLRLPSNSYYNQVEQGYRDFGICLNQLRIARKRAEEEKYLWSWNDLVDNEAKSCYHFSSSKTHNTVKE